MAGTAHSPSSQLCGHGCVALESLLMAAFTHVFAGLRGASVVSCSQAAALSDQGPTLWPIYRSPPADRCPAQTGAGGRGADLKQPGQEATFWKREQFCGMPVAKSGFWRPRPQQ